MKKVCTKYVDVGDSSGSGGGGGGGGGGSRDPPAIYIQTFPTLCLFLASTSCVRASPQSTLCVCAHPQLHIVRVCQSSTAHCGCVLP